MILGNYHSVYLIGIGGIGMSALARWFLANGKEVAGYDRIPSPHTAKMQAEGMDIHFVDDLSLVPSYVKDQKAHTLIIFTPAVPKALQELKFFVQEGYEVKKRAEVLGAITQGSFTVAVAGTHGKTTTSSMIAHLLVSAGKNCTAFLGGIATNFDSNLVVGEMHGEGLITVVEADEYDRSFLQLHPDISVITSMEADHLDIYGKDEALKESFQAFARQTVENGHLLLQSEVSLMAGDSVTKKTYGLKQGDIRAMNVRVNEGTFSFDYVTGNEEFNDLELGVPGFHNVENATAAIAVALQCGLSEAEVREGLATFSGVKRRFEYIIKGEDIIYIDDYAHHPTEISALLGSVRTLYPDRKVTMIFQPHLFTRTRDLMDGFVSSLSGADAVILLDVYPAREEPIPGVSSKVILERISSDNKYLLNPEELLDMVQGIGQGVLLTVGAGDIDRLVEPIRKILSERNHG